MREESFSHSGPCIVIIAQRTSFSPLLTAPQRQPITSISHSIHFMLTVWDETTFEHVDNFFFTTQLYCWMRSPFLLILTCIWVNLKCQCSPGCQLPPKLVSTMALNHQRTYHDHKEGEPSLWGSSSVSFKQKQIDRPVLTNNHCTQTTPNIRAADWPQVLSPSSLFVKK